MTTIETRALAGTVALAVALLAGCSGGGGGTSYGPGPGGGGGGGGNGGGGGGGGSVDAGVVLPDHCPCPTESYCDLSSNRCVLGCRADRECNARRICQDDLCRDGCRSDDGCGAGQICEGVACKTGCRTDDACPGGQICDGTLCRAGCRSDGACTGPGALCDTTALVCRLGCHQNGDCPLAQVCNPARSCVPGCDVDARCPSGQICDQSQCRAGCRADAVCPLGHICDVATSTCIVGCSRDGASYAAPGRCAADQACVPGRYCTGMLGGNCDWRCSDMCSSGWKCDGEAAGTHVCIGKKRCRETCTYNTDCPSGQICTWFTTNTSYPGDYRVGLCAKPCAADADCSATVDSYGMSNTSCKCKSDGICKWTDTYVCYQYDAEYGR